MIALPVVVRGALIGGGVGGALALVRHTPDGDAETSKAARILKSAAEGALAGAAVGFALDRTLRHRAAELVAANAPVLLDAAGELARRYEPAVERAVELARERAHEAYEKGRPIVADAYEVARPRVDEAVELVRQRALELRSA